MAKVYLGFGSNKGDRLGFLKAALSGIMKLGRTRLDAVSSVYETEPVGKKDQGEFLNAVARIDTALAPGQLLQELKKLEQGLGRKERVRWGPREIDIDILYYDDLIVNDGALRIPHGELANRRFVLIPLSEISTEIVDPVRKLGIADLLKFCPDTSSVRKTKLGLALDEKNGSDR